MNRISSNSSSRVLFFSSIVVNYVKCNKKKKDKITIEYDELNFKFISARFIKYFIYSIVYSSFCIYIYIYMDISSFFLSIWAFQIVGCDYDYEFRMVYINIYIYIVFKLPQQLGT